MARTDKTPAYACKASSFSNIWLSAIYHFSRVVKPRSSKKYFSNSSKPPLLTFLAGVAKILGLTANAFASGAKY